MQLIIAFWRVVTLPCNWDDQPIGTKIVGYREKAIRVINRMEAERNRLGLGGAKMIFIAPEHLFRRSTSRNAMPEGDKAQVIAAVKQISSNHPDVMLIPGTIVWLEESRFAKMFNRKFEARNSAFVFLHGDVIFQYNKHSNADELLDAEKAEAVFKPGQKLGVFKCWDVRFGIEICFDHTHATLYKQLQKKGKDGVDVHLVVSSTVPNLRSNVATRSGGLLVHADGQDFRDSHTPQPGTQGAKGGVWQMQERDTPLGGGHFDDLAKAKKENRGRFIDLNRRLSVTARPGAAPAAPFPGLDDDDDSFRGFDDDVSVYNVTVS